MNVSLTRFDALPRREEAEQDVDALLAAFKLQAVRRYFWQKHWRSESARAVAADRIEAGLKLENVAAHSWHVADATILLAPNFPELDVGRSTQLAVLHDKLEMFTGDFDPVGVDGQGNQTHAFDEAAKAEKVRLEQEALDEYLSSLRGKARAIQSELLNEIMEGASQEAKLVKSIDKLQALAFVLIKKDGKMSDSHIVFSLRYSSKAVEYFPPLSMHYDVLVQRLLERVAAFRKADLSQLYQQILGKAEELSNAA